MSSAKRSSTGAAAGCRVTEREAWTARVTLEDILFYLQREHPERVEDIRHLAAVIGFLDVEPFPMESSGDPLDQVDQMLAETDRAIGRLDRQQDGEGSE